MIIIFVSDTCKGMYMFLVAGVIIYALYTAFFVILSPNESILHKTAAMAVFISGLWIGISRDTYLPFLGRTAIPPTVLKDSAYPQHSNTTIVLNLPHVSNGTKVVYWGAKPATQVKSNPMQAYDDFSNAGVAIVVNGKATLRFHCPGQYIVGSLKTLNRHVHYRVYDRRGLLGPVKTHNVKC